MRTFILAAFLSAGLAFSFGASGQAYGSYFNLNYSMGAPLGTLSDWTGNFSGRGFEVDYRYMVNGSYSVGLSSGWNVFRDESDGDVSQTINLENSTAVLTAKQFKYTNLVPIMANFHYYLTDIDDKPIYVGSGIGTYYSERRLEMGLYVLTESTWSFGLSPEVGIFLPLGSSYLNLALQYNLVFAAESDLENVEDPGFDHLGIKIGIGFN